MTKALSFISDKWLLYVFLCLLWPVVDSNTTLTPNLILRSAPIPTTTKPATTTPPQPPDDVTNVNVTARTESSITLTWGKVNNIPTYYIQYEGKEEFIKEDNDSDTVSYEATSLTPGTKYNFIIITHSNGVNSTGTTFNFFTLPGNVANVDVTDRTESSISLTWSRVNNTPTYYIKYGGKDYFINEDSDTVSYEAAPLTAGTKYTFTIITLFNELNSTGTTKEASTRPRNAENFMVVSQTEKNITLQWKRVENSLYILKHQLSPEEFDFDIPKEETEVIRTINDLENTTEYRFTLFTEFDSDRSSGANLTAYTAPPNPVHFESVAQKESNITLRWRKVGDLLKYRLEFDGRQEDVTASEGQDLVTYTVDGLTNGTKYDFSLFTVFENVTSSGVNLPSATAPLNTKEFNKVKQNDTSITLQWRKVDNFLHYRLEFDDRKENVNASEEQDIVTYTVDGLTHGTKYDFSVFTMFENVKSSGVSLPAATEPSKVASVSVADRSVDSVTLKWPNPKEDWDYILRINETEFQVPGSKDAVIVLIPNLTAGTKYTFTVTTEFFELTSSAYEDFTVTQIDCEKQLWHTLTSSITGTVNGLVSHGTAFNGSHSHNVSVEGKNVSVSGLYPGATYEIFLTYKEEAKSFDQCTHKEITNPEPTEARCKYAASGYSVHIAWDTPGGVWTAVEVITPKSTQTVSAEEGQHVEISGFQPANTYKVTVTTISGNKKSLPYAFSCATDPRGVIAGSVMGVLIFVILVVVAVVIVRKRPEIISKNPFTGGSKDKKKKSSAIPVEKFPDHFYQLGMDENRGFSLEYESLMPVGTEQTLKAASLPENKPRNRFSNVLPYDWCRVKLSSSDGASDYINANHMPGYNSSREYIATQGPLPSTVNDFWRMIWEQRVKGIVMVTNCKESGKTKCEQYWPEDRNPCIYGQLSVTITSEQKEFNWTLREFTVRHNNSSEQRTVKHFHFTAWPDHGVPQGTEVLIQFRGLVRQHIEREGTGAPTVVHCSAGVGRTGTIMALDVLLQQLERERAVGINAFVHKMRLNRPHMVQTESQYIFLHQCIMDILQQNERPMENIYENDEMFYANATALREFQKNGKV